MFCKCGVCDCNCYYTIITQPAVFSDDMDIERIHDKNDLLLALMFILPGCILTFSLVMFYFIQSWLKQHILKVYLETVGKIRQSFCFLETGERVVHTCCLVVLCSYSFHYLGNFLFLFNYSCSNFPPYLFPALPTTLPPLPQSLPTLLSVSVGHLHLFFN